MKLVTFRDYQYLLRFDWQKKPIKLLAFLLSGVPQNNLFHEQRNTINEVIEKYARLHVRYLT